MVRRLEKEGVIRKVAMRPWAGQNEAMVAEFPPPEDPETQSRAKSPVLNRSIVKHARRRLWRFQLSRLSVVNGRPREKRRKQRGGTRVETWLPRGPARQKSSHPVTACATRETDETECRVGGEGGVREKQRALKRGTQ